MPSSSCHFRKYKSVFLQILHQFSVPSNVTSLYILARTFMLCFGQKQLIKVQIFEIFKCSGENLPNSSCHFPDHKPVFLQILHDSSVSWKITPLYFKDYILCTKRTNQSANFEDFWVLGSKFTKIFHFWNNKLVFLQILRQSSISWDITPLYFFHWNFIYFQQKENIKVQIWWNFYLSSQNFSEILHFDGLLL